MKAPFDNENSIVINIQIMIDEIYIMFIFHITFPTQCSRLFISVNSFKPHSKPFRHLTIRQMDKERFNIVPKITHVVSASHLI